MKGNRPGIQLRSPRTVDTAGKIQLRVEALADRRTYYDNNGELDEALTVLLVRTDAPGLTFVATQDPNLWLEPMGPLSGRPSDAQLDADPGLHEKEWVVDINGFGPKHKGSAKYLVFSSFARWWTGPAPLQVTDTRGRVSPAAVPIAALPGPGPLAPPDKPGVLLAARRGKGGWILDVGFAVTAVEGEREPWVSLLGFRLESRGGAGGAVYKVPSQRDGGLVRGSASVAWDSLTGNTGPGRWVMFAAVGEVLSKPVKLTVRESG